MMPELGRNLLDEAGSARCKWTGDMESTPCHGDELPAVGSQVGASDLASIDHRAYELISTLGGMMITILDGGRVERSKTPRWCEPWFVVRKGAG